MTQRKEKLFLKGKIVQFTVTDNETVREEFFEAPRCGSRNERMTTKENKKSRSTKFSAPKAATQQKPDTLAGKKSKDVNAKIF